MDIPSVNKQTFFGFLSETWTKLIDEQLSYIEPQILAQECILECFVEIPIVGKNTFLLVLAMPKKLSYEVGASLFQLPCSELNDADANDAMSELANILAGQVQRQLNEDTLLDIPAPLSKNEAQNIMKNIEPDWEVFARHNEEVIYAGVFTG